jgi:hypothetical protein
MLDFLKKVALHRTSNGRVMVLTLGLKLASARVTVRATKPYRGESRREQVEPQKKKRIAKIAT